MNNEVILTCAVTGSGDSHLKHPHVPSTPQEIAAASIAAAKAGAAIVHIHVREADGTPSRRLALYEETVKRIRESDTDIIINLTAGMGGDYIENSDNPAIPGPGSDMATAAQRVAHVEKLKPEICTLDCGSVNYASSTYLATYAMLQEMAGRITAAGVLAEVEAFELGHIWQAKELIKKGLLPDNTMFQLCMGIPYGAEATLDNFVAMKNALPDNVNWGAFGIGKNQFPLVALTAIAGGNIRVGLEDNIYLDKGIFASNAQLVEKAVNLLNELGTRVLTPGEARKKLGL